MADPKVRKLGSFYDADGIQVHVGVDYDLVTIQQGTWASGAGARLTAAQTEMFAQLFTRACWEAANRHGV